MFRGCFTAIITPFNSDGIDYAGLERLIDYQVQNGVTGILAVGTTGESPVLSWEEHNDVIRHVRQRTAGKCLCIAGAGSNNTNEALNAAKHAEKIGVDAVLLVDPYYNGPSSLEIRKEYVEPVAAAVPDIQVIPYVIPGRTGTQLLPEDLALAHRKYNNVSIVKEATGNLDNMKRTRQCCGENFTILSGDDRMTFSMMTDRTVAGAGVISVASNIVPKAVSDMVRFLENGNLEKGEQLAKGLLPLFKLVTVTTKEISPHGEVTFRARNPLATKALMNILGMPSGMCRQPLGRLTKNGLDVVISTAKRVLLESPDVFKPLEDAFNVDIDERLNNPENWEGLFYIDYD